MSSLWRRLNQTLATGRFVRGVAVLAGGAALGQAVVILASPLLTRLYTPEDFGVLAVYISILSILLVVASLCYELSIPIPEDDETAANLLALCLAIVSGMSLLTGIGVWILGDRIVNWTNTPALSPYLWLLPLGLLGSGIYQVFNYWAVRGKAFTRIARTRLNQSLGQVLTQLGLGLMQIGPVGLLLGQVVGRTAGSSTLATLAFRQDRGSFKRISLVKVGWAARQYRRFPMFLSGSALLNSAGLQLPALLLAAFYGPQVAGWFALGQRVIGVPIELVGVAVSQAYLGEAPALARDNPRALYRLFIRTVLWMSLIISLPIGLVALFGPELFAFIFGQEWSEAGLYVQLLGVTFAVRFAVAPLAQTFNVLGRQDLTLALNIGRFVLVAGSLLLAAGWYQLSPAITVALYSASMFLVYTSMLTLMLYALRLRLKLSDPGGERA